MAKEIVLVTGGAGFIGSHVIDLLLKKGYFVRVLDNLSPKTHSDKWPKYLDERVEKIKGDVRNKKDWETALKNVSYVIHLAAYMDLMPDFSTFFAINTTGTANLYEVIVANKIPIKKIVVASSQFVYGQGKWKCKKHGVVFPKERDFFQLEKKIWDPVCPECGRPITSVANTEDYVNPPNPYAISKYTQEMIAIKLGQLYDIPSTALRYSIVHGPRQSIKNLYSGSLRIFTTQLLSGLPTTIFEDGKQLRDFISVYDAASATVFAMENRKTDFKVFNVGGKKAITVIDLAKMLANYLGKELEVKFSGYRVGDIRHAISDTSRLEKLGWKLQHTEKKAAKEFVDEVLGTRTWRSQIGENISQK